MGVRRGDLVVILGGCGFIGRVLISRLHAQGLRLRVVTRRMDRNRDLLVLPHLELVAGNVHDEHVLRTVLVGCQAVVNLVGTVTERRPQDFQRVHTELPARLGRVGKGLRIVHVSAVGADERAPSAYLRSKAAGEARLLALIPAAVILRPNVVYGPHDHFVDRFVRLLRLAPLGLPVPLAESVLAPIHVSDVVSCLVQALLTLPVEGKTYELCGPDVLTLGAIVKAVASARSQRFAPWPLPDSVSLLLARFFEHLPGEILTVDQWRTLKGGALCAPGSSGCQALSVDPRPFLPSLPDLVGRPIF